jgi:hypothetical protein
MIFDIKSMKYRWIIGKNSFHHEIFIILKHYSLIDIKDELVS